jgi:hypothetical protein
MLSIKTLAILALLPAGGLCAYRYASSECCGGAASGPVVGRYVEARSASVFAGACHFGSEYTTQGREALLAFELEGGSEAGVDLTGVELVVVLSGDRNLAESDVARRSVVYVDADLDSARREASLAWLRREHAELLGEVAAVRSGPVAVEIGAETYRVSAIDGALLEGGVLPDRACCTMPSNVWYEPEVELTGRLVGLSTRLVLDEPALNVDLERLDENNAFVGSLGAERTSGGCAAKLAL